jgi:hypothetical protein
MNIKRLYGTVEADEISEIEEAIEHREELMSR